MKMVEKAQADNNRIIATQYSMKMIGRLVSGDRSSPSQGRVLDLSTDVPPSSLANGMRGPDGKKLVATQLSYSTAAGTQFARYNPYLTSQRPGGKKNDSIYDNEISNGPALLGSSDAMGRTINLDRHGDSIFTNEMRASGNISHREGQASITAMNNRISLQRHLNDGQEGTAISNNTFHLDRSYPVPNELARDFINN